MIEVERVSVSYGRRRILGDVSLRAEAGQLTAIVGPNGCGKTTLLRALSGNLDYTGKISILSRDLSTMRPGALAAIRAVLPQSAAMAFPFTVREVVALGIRAYGECVTQSLAPPTPEQALARVDLSGFEGRFYQQLSGGEQQRVQLARVLCQVWHPVVDGLPRLLLLDEPISSLDIRHQLLIMAVARDFCTRGGCVLAVLHDLNIAGMFADQAILMHAGKIVEAGPVGEVFDDDNLSAVFGCGLRVGALPAGGKPFILPHCIVS